MKCVVGIALTLTLIGGVSTATTSAHAQPNAADPARADKLFREARALVRQRDFERACPLFAESQRLDPAAGTLVNLGDCHDARHMTASALRAYEAALALLKPGDGRLEPVTRQVADLNRRAPRLEVSLSPSGSERAEVRAGDQSATLDQDQRTATLRLDPGVHEVVIEVAGGKRERHEVSLDEGSTRELVVGAISRQPPSRPPGDAPGGSDTESSMRTWAYVSGGVGLAFTLFGGYSLLRQGSIEDEREGICPSQTNCTTDEIRRDRALEDDSSAAGQRAAIGLGLGAVGIAGGVALFIMSSEKKASAKPRPAPIVGRGFVGLELGGVW